MYDKIDEIFLFYFFIIMITNILQLFYADIFFIIN